MTSAPDVTLHLLSCSRGVGAADLDSCVHGQCAVGHICGRRRLGGSCTDEYLQSHEAELVTL